MCGTQVRASGALSLSVSHSTSPSSSSSPSSLIPPHCKREAKEQGGLLAALARPQINGAERGLGVGRATLTCDEQKKERQGPTVPKETYSSRAHGCPQASVLVCSTLSYCSELTAEGRRGGRGGSGGCL